MTVCRRCWHANPDGLDECENEDCRAFIGPENAHPLAAMLPAVLQDDDMTARLASAFDVLLAPVLSTLDNIDAYLDPHLAPEEFVTWLAGWVGLVVDETWKLERTREFVAEAVALAHSRGTVAGLRTLLVMYTGVDPEIIESGGTSVSPTHGGALPGQPNPSLLVRVHVPDPSTIDLRRLTDVVAAACPAHIPRRVEVLAT